MYVCLAGLSLSFLVLDVGVGDWVNCPKTKPNHRVVRSSYWILIFMLTCLPVDIHMLFAWCMYGWVEKDIHETLVTRRVRDEVRLGDELRM